GPSRPVTASPASPSWGWTWASTPATCCARCPAPSPPTTPADRSTTNWPPSVPPPCSQPSPTSPGARPTRKSRTTASPPTPPRSASRRRRSTGAGTPLSSTGGFAPSTPFPWPTPSSPANPCASGARRRCPPSPARPPAPCSRWTTTASPWPAGTAPCASWKSSCPARSACPWRSCCGETPGCSPRGSASGPTPHDRARPAGSPILKAREACARVLGAVLRNEASLNSLLPLYLAKVPVAERALAQELCYGTLRWYPALELLLAALIDKPLKPKDAEITGLLAAGLYQLRAM